MSSEGGKVTLPACLNLNHSSFFEKKNYSTVCTHPQPTMFLQMGPQKILHSNLGTAGCNEVKGLEQNGKKVESGLAT